MKAFLFYLSFPFIYLVASLPFKALYALSDVLYFLLNLAGYRKKIVLKNLRNSFPEKTEQEIQNIAKVYFQYLSDLILETLKTLKMTEKETKERCVLHQPEWLKTLYEAKKSLIIVMGHYGNWEWAGPSFTLNTNYQLVVIYRPLTNPYFETMMVKMRTKFGTKITPVNNTLREMVANRSSITATAFIADQTASPDFAYWTNFLNQDTAVFNGPEKLAKKFNYPVVYMNVKRTKRGFYEIFPEMMVAEPKDTSDNFILETFTQRLEKEIKLDPSIWLWSHRRWKHQRSADGQVNTILK